MEVGGMFPGRVEKPRPPSELVLSFGSSSPSREMRDNVLVMVAGLHVLTSLKRTGRGEEG